MDPRNNGRQQLVPRRDAHRNHRFVFVVRGQPGFFAKAVGVSLAATLVVLAFVFSLVVAVIAAVAILVLLMYALYWRIHMRGKLNRRGPHDGH